MIKFSWILVFLALAAIVVAPKPKVKTRCEQDGHECVPAALKYCKYDRSYDKDCHKLHGLTYCCKDQKKEKGKTKEKIEAKPKDKPKDKPKGKRSVDLSNETGSEYEEGSGTTPITSNKNSMNRNEPTEEMVLDPVDDGFPHTITLDPYGNDIYDDEK